MKSISISTLTKAAALALAGIVSASSAQAITQGGNPDNGEHPYVGLSVYFDENWNPMWRCSGTMISPTVYLTAGHCTEGAAHAAIFFEEDVDAVATYPFPGPDQYTGTPYLHPSYDSQAFFLYDLGVVVTDSPVILPMYGALPELGQLDPWLKKRGLQDTTVKAVGYGLQAINPVSVTAMRIRLQADLNLITLKGSAGVPPNTSIGLTNNPTTGGTCFGDSGGPNFLNDTNIVVAVTSFGLNGNCKGTGWGYRVDQSDDLDWLYSTFGDQLN